MPAFLQSRFSPGHGPPFGEPTSSGGQDSAPLVLLFTVFGREEPAAGQRAAGFATRGETLERQKLSRRQTVWREIQTGGSRCQRAGLTSPRTSARPRRTSVWGVRHGRSGQYSSCGHQAAVTRQPLLRRVVVKRWLGHHQGRGGSQAEREERGGPQPSPRSPPAHPASGQWMGVGGPARALSCWAPQPSQVLPAGWAQAERPQ